MGILSHRKILTWKKLCLRDCFGMLKNVKQNVFSKRFLEAFCQSENICQLQQRTDLFYTGFKIYFLKMCSVKLILVF